MQNRASRRPSASRQLSAKGRLAKADKIIRQHLSASKIEGDVISDLLRRLDYHDVRLQGNCDMLAEKLDAVLRLLHERDGGDSRHMKI